MSVKIITTSDGSHSLLDDTLNETYHSVHGAIQESAYVFIKNGLVGALGKNSLELAILEVGFGTGLNALLTLQLGNERRQKIHYTTIEPYPVPEEIWSKLNYSDVLSLAPQFRSLHHSSWELDQCIDPYFTLLKRQVTIQELDIAGQSFDLVYYDAFAPSKQPELWELPVLEKISKALRSGGFFVTYCAKGQLKRDLRSLGLSVETLPGAPGKKEMIRATKT